MTTLTPSSECPHGSDPALCPPCNRPGRSVAPWEPQDGPPSDIGPTFHASYHGECEACANDIEPGDPICSSSFGYIHAECA